MVTRDHGVSTPRATRRRFLQAAGAASSVAGMGLLLPHGRALAAPKRSLQEAKRGGTLQMALNQESATIDPHKSRDAAGTQIKGMIYSQLLKYYYGRELVPDLAESYEALDEVTYVFNLRRGVQFHDGAALTSRDVVASYERILDPATGASVYPYISSIETVTARDDHTVEFKLKQPLASFIPAMGLPGNYIAQQAKIDANVDFETDIVGTGPFKLASRSVSVETKLARNESYFLEGLPYLDGIVFRPIFDDPARMNALYSGDVDIITYVTWAAMGDIQDDPQYILQSNPEDGFVMIEFRVDQPPFDDVRLRQAVSYGIDREAIINTAASGRGVPNFGGLIPSWMWAYNQELADTYRYDPERARQLIKEVGAEGLKIEFTTWPPDTELFGRPSVVVANQLQQVGLEVTLRPQPVAEWQQTRAEGTYQMFMDGNLYNLADPDFMYTYYYTGTRVPAANRFSDPEIDAWLDEARQLSDQDARKALYDKIQAKTLDLVPIAPLFYREQGEASQNDVHGHEYIGSLGYTSTLLETWLDR